MARKPVRVKRFTNVDQLEIGQKAKFIGEDGLEYETSPIEHFNIHADGRVSITTKSGSQYANFDIEAQQAQEQAEWEASRTSRDRLSAAKSVELYQLMAFNKMVPDYNERHFYKKCAEHIGNRNEQGYQLSGIGHVGFDPTTALLWREGKHCC